MPEEPQLTPDEQAVHDWAAAQKISMESVKCLLKDGFTSLDALRLLEKEDLTHKIPRGQQRLILHAVGEIRKHTTSSADSHQQDADGSAARETSCLLYTSPSPRDGLLSRMPSSA